jgi:two-component system, NtrC family, nitrogen regulation sensor histidine kinase NtrY
MKLAAKLTLAFGAVTLLPLVPLTLLARELIANRYREELVRSLDGSKRETERSYDTAAREMERTAARLARGDDDLVRELTRAFTFAQNGALSDDQRAELSDIAAQSARTRALDVLLAVAADGTVLAAPGDPGREGKVEAALVQRLRDAGPHARVVEERPHFVHADPGRLAIEAVRELALPTVPRRSVWLLAGVWLDEAVPELTGPVIERHVRPSAAAPPGALVAHVELDAGGAERPIPVELWAFDRTLHAVLADLNVGAAALALGGVVLALIVGAMVARRISTRLTTLAEAFDMVARGRRELSVPDQGGDEVASLSRHFNEMVTALSDAEQTAVRAERVAAWREMAQHLAHELKNPLTPIQMSVETLIRARQRPDRAAFENLFEESAKVILDEVTRLKHIVGEFSRFARLPTPTFAPVDLRELCEAAAKLYESATPIERQLEPDLPPARADRDQLQQVLVNLLENAREAVTGLNAPRIVVRTQRMGDRVVLEVLDNGPGIADSIRARLFQPYATGKPGGTGLGLALVLRIVSEHGGRVTAQEGLGGEHGPGACFRVELPVAS